MTPRTHDHRARGMAWRLGTPLMFTVAGALFVVSATSSQGTDLRPGRVNDLPSLVRSESRQAEDLTAQVQQLSGQVERLSAQVDDDQVRKARQAADKRARPAGFKEVHGDALTVTLSDAPEELREDADDLDRLVVHQQDIQAVVNAMWDAGAKGITIQGQRIISTTGIKCAGNSVELQGIPYPQPFVITAVGDVETMQARIDADATVGGYRLDAANPAIDVGWEMTESTDVTLPAYDGVRVLEHAQPLA